MASGSRPNIYDYLDYRVFMRDLLEARRWSYGQIARWSGLGRATVHNRAAEQAVAIPVLVERGVALDVLREAGVPTKTQPGPARMRAERSSATERGEVCMVITPEWGGEAMCRPETSSVLFLNLHNGGEIGVSGASLGRVFSKLAVLLGKAGVHVGGRVRTPEPAQPAWLAFPPDGAPWRTAGMPAQEGATGQAPRTLSPFAPRTSPTV